MPRQRHLIPDQPTPEQTARDTQRAEYLERLCEKLRDPAFRATESFPIGQDKATLVADSLTLPDPPIPPASPALGLCAPAARAARADG
jgi:hypothetical protein